MGCVSLDHFAASGSDPSTPGSAPTDAHGHSHHANQTTLSETTEAILGAPFAWCWVKGGPVVLEDGRSTGGTSGGEYWVRDFAMAKFPITNAQYRAFLDDPTGYANPGWWYYSEAGIRWRHDRRGPKPTAFGGATLPRTRVSWFDAMAFCAWLSTRIADHGSDEDKLDFDLHDSATWTIRLPSEQQWQRAALGDTSYRYPWGDELDESRGNYGGHVGQTSPVDRYVAGESPFAVRDLIGNVWEWCLTAWGSDVVNPGDTPIGTPAVGPGTWRIPSISGLPTVAGCRPVDFSTMAGFASFGASNAIGECG